MVTFNKEKNHWNNLKVGITGANGSLGRSLIKSLRGKGAYIVGFTHGSNKEETKNNDCPNEWVKWEAESNITIEKYLLDIDILIINHGINEKGKQGLNEINRSLKINALSSWRLIEIFEEIIKKNKPYTNHPKEIWINTSEAEIQPAFSPTYEISKRLLGELVSLKWANRSKEDKRILIIRKLILGPFKSKLNPIGIMTSDFVASQIINQVDLNLNLIIITPNPLTYILIPINELIRFIYNRVTREQENIL